MSADPHAPTAHAYDGPERRHAGAGCAAGERALTMLIGDGKEPGVFEEMRSIKALVRTRGNLIVAFTGVLAVCAVLSLVLR